MIKLGLIGAGFMGSAHASCYEALLACGFLKVTAVADLDAERASKLAEKFGAKIYNNGEELIETADVNTVDICLPTYLHTEHALLSMEKGYNTIIEKPVCLNALEAEELLEVERRTGAKVAVAQCIRFWHEYVYLKQLIDQTVYGEIVSAAFKRISPRPLWGWEQWLHDSKKSGSAAMDLHIHDVDYVRYILGVPDRIKTEATRINGNNEHIFSLFTYGDVVVSVEGGWDYPSSMPFEMEYRVKFENATVVFNSCKTPPLAVYHEDGTVSYPETDAGSKSNDLGGNISDLGGYYNELKYFIECFENNVENEIAPLKEGIKSIKLNIREIEALEG